MNGFNTVILLILSLLIGKILKCIYNLDCVSSKTKYAKCVFRGEGKVFKKIVFKY